jgi:hypothetical protein
MSSGSHGFQADHVPICTALRRAVSRHETLGSPESGARPLITSRRVWMDLHAGLRCRPPPVMAASPPVKVPRGTRLLCNALGWNPLRSRVAPCRRARRTHRGSRSTAGSRFKRLFGVVPDAMVAVASHGHIPSVCDRPETVRPYVGGGRSDTLRPGDLDPERAPPAHRSPGVPVRAGARRTAYRVG